MKYSEFLFWISISIVFIPILLQLKIGSYFIKHNKRKYFDWLFGINLALQIITTLLSFIIQGISFHEKALENGWTYPPFNLAPPIIGFPISFILGISLLIVIFLQLKKFNKKAKE